MKVEILYVKECLNHVPAVEQVRLALRAEGLTEGVEEIEVQDADMAQALGFLGSPSIRVNGLDIEKEARHARGVGFGCRTYLEAGRRSGVPSVEMIRRALVEAADSGS